MTVSDDFTGLAGPFRGELLAHCYRMLGSAEEAEDLVQETYLRAWRSYAGFEGRASVRTWLYRIATNVCLTAIERRGRRPLPAGLGAPSTDPEIALVAGPEVPWLQPLPWTAPPGPGLAGADPAAVAGSRAGIRLAFVAALQYLSARQRAMLIMRDVLEWSAADVADLLGTTTTAVNSGLRRARAQLARALPAEDELAEPAEPDRRALLDQFAAAIENADASALAGLLRAEVALEMPPVLTWFTGRETVTRFIASHFLTEPGGLRLVPVTANGEPAFAVYRREPTGVYQAHALLVPTLTPTGIARIIAFQDLALFGLFGLPRGLGDERAAPFGQKEGGKDVPDVALRAVQDADVDALYEQGRDPESVLMAAFTAEDPDDRSAFEAHLARVTSAPDITMRAVTWDGRLVGSIASFVVEGQHEVTYWIDRAAWGQGIATRAMGLLLELVPVRPLYARAASDNTGSLQVLRKSGFTIIGTEVSFAQARKGEIEETILRLD